MSVLKKDITEVLATPERLGITKKDAAERVEAVIESVAELVKQEGAVRIPGFGVFEEVERAARKGRNPQTGEEINIQASKSVKFRPSKGLKDRIEG